MAQRQAIASAAIYALRSHIFYPYTLFCVIDLICVICYKFVRLLQPNDLNHVLASVVQTIDRFAWAGNIGPDRRLPGRAGSGGKMLRLALRRLLQSFRLSSGKVQAHNLLGRRRPTQFDAIETLEKRALLSGIWISADELIGLPTTGDAWKTLLTAAAEETGAPSIQDQDNDADVLTLAKALVGVRTGNEQYISQARSNVIAAIGTEVGGKTLALGRNLLSYVVAADIVGLEPDHDAQFRAWLTQTLTEKLDSQTLRDTHEKRPNNWGTMAGASRAAVAAYLGDQAELTRVAQVFRGWLGDTTSYTGFDFGSDRSWQADSRNPVAVNPIGAIKDGHIIDGALPEEMRRGGSFNWPPIMTGYPWGALQGAVAQAEILYRAGFDSWEWEGRALLRAAQFLNGLCWPAANDDGWATWLLDARYGTGFATDPEAGPGKNMGWTAWTHQVPSALPVSKPPSVDAGSNFSVLVNQQMKLRGRASDDGLPNPPGSIAVNWEMVSGPGVVSFDTQSKLDPTVQFNKAGKYVLRLEASDGTNCTVDDITITVATENLPPVVSAGTDQRVVVLQPVVLRGTVSDDRLPNPPSSVTVLWSLVSGPGPVDFSDPTESRTITTFGLVGDYVLRLTAFDGQFQSIDDVMVTVNPENAAPIIEAGLDQEILISQSASLHGTATDDLLPNPPGLVTFQWSQIIGPGTATITNATLLDTSVLFSEPGNYVLRLTGFDGSLYASDEVSILVSPETLSLHISAGANQTISARQSASLQGEVLEGSSPGFPEPLIFLWTQMAGPGSVTFGDPAALATFAAFSQPGVYVLRLMASAGSVTAADELTVTVAPGNLAPVVDAGSDQSISVTRVVRLQGVITDDGLPVASNLVSATWSKLSGPGAVSFENSSSATTMARFSEAGVYALRLLGNDGLLTAFDDVVVTITPPNLAPVVVARRNQAIRLNQAAQVSGTAVDDGLPTPGRPLTYQWTKLTGPGDVTFGNASALNTDARFSMAGRYTIRLTASDGELSGWFDITFRVTKSPRSSQARRAPN